MNKYSFENGGKTCGHITKKQARAAYNSGETVVLCPVKMRPFTPWHLEQYVCKKSGDADTFDAIANRYEYYNCHGEAGRYTAFYVQIGGAAI